MDPEKDRRLQSQSEGQFITAVTVAGTSPFVPSLALFPSGDTKKARHQLPVQSAVLEERNPKLSGPNSCVMSVHKPA